MALTRVIFESLFIYLYFRKDKELNYKNSLKIGILFFAISVIIDSCLFMEGPMKMSFTNYILDIGLLLHHQQSQKQS
ncbi:MAG: hypothetical protein KO202_06340 [Methanobacteriaceae archaeon]|jgi:hypothetical protein|nr:hypothetical protein [Methanobacteriaceae archaeon]